MASTPRPSLVAASTRREQSRRASMSRPESSSSSTAMPGRNRPSCTVSLRFFSPPERSTFRDRSKSRGSRPMAFASARISVGTTEGSRPAAAKDASSTSTRLTPGTSMGYCRARNSPACARSHGSMASKSAPSRVTDPPVTVYPGRPASTWDSVDLPDPLGPITACTSPERTTRSTPRRISLPATSTRKPSMASSVAFIAPPVRRRHRCAARRWAPAGWREGWRAHRRSARSTTRA